MGVLERPGIAEACSDLARLSGFKAIAMYAPLLNPKGKLQTKAMQENLL